MIRKNMKYYVGALLVYAIGALFLAGCGAKEEETAHTEAVEMEIPEKEGIENIESKVAEELVEEDGESVEEEITYREQNDIYLLNNACNEGVQIDLASFEFDNKQYTLTKSVDIYYTDGTLAGYTKENVPVYVVSSGDEWSFCSFDTSGFLIKKDELMDSVLIEEEKADDFVEPVPVPQEIIHFDATVKSDTKEKVSNEVAKEAIKENSVSSESNKYTPEEAISVYRSLMEAGGITWDPSIKDVTSWGTGWIYLDKGYPEWCASTDLESFAMGDSGGRSWTKYYLEVTGSDEDAVYITEWSSN